MRTISEREQEAIEHVCDFITNVGAAYPATVRSRLARTDGELAAEMAAEWEVNGDEGIEIELLMWAIRKARKVIKDDYCL